MKKLSKSAFARAEGVSPSLVTRWLRLGLPVGQDGLIEPAEARAWLAKNTEHSQESVESLTEARARAASLLADLRAMELARARGTLIAVDVVTEEQARGDQIIANAMLSIPDRVSPKLVGLPLLAIREVLMKEIRLAMGAAAQELAGE